MARKCAFTSGESCGSGDASADCRRRAGANVIICCSRCSPAKPVYRCSCCYHKFSSAIKVRAPEIEMHNGVKLRREPAIDALLEIDWRSLASTGACEHPALKKIGPDEFVALRHVGDAI